MSRDQLEEKLIDYVQDAHSMETNVLQMLESMINTTDDERIKRDLQRHKDQTERHEERLRNRLEKLGRGVSMRKEAQTMFGGLFKGLTDQVRGDKAGKNARDGFVTEHMEIAAYELLERLAERAGDNQTARIARQNKRDEEMMAKKIAANWDKFVDLTLAENGIEAPKPSRRTSTAKRTTAKRTTASRKSGSAGSSTARKRTARKTSGR
jgi:ferritin-like metal-binding protein YciE